MTKKDMLKEIASELDITQVRAAEVVDGLERLLNRVIENRDEVIICGIKIGTKERKGRAGKIDNQIGCYEYETPDKIVPYIKFTKSTKERLTKEV